MREIGRIAEKRGVIIESREVQRTAAVRCSPRLQSVLADAVARAGVKPCYLPSGAGHDAMMFDGITDIAMLFVRCGNGGVSHSPREIITAEDADIAARVILDTVLRLAETS
jgi:acetylornithine deacetylase/succinyl-diaminopimelate desuccinylase-like protein